MSAVPEFLIAGRILRRSEARPLRNGLRLKKARESARTRGCVFSSRVPANRLWAFRVERLKTRAASIHPVPPSFRAPILHPGCAPLETRVDHHIGNNCGPALDL